MTNGIFLDINECSEDSDNCSQFCNNTIGSYQCYCEDGYTLDSDEHSCNGIIYTSSIGQILNNIISASSLHSKGLWLPQSLLLQILMNVLRILILVMVMPVVLTPLDPTTAHVTLDLKEMDLLAMVCTADIWNYCLFYTIDCYGLYSLILLCKCFSPFLSCSFCRNLQPSMFVSILVLWTVMSMLTV